MSKILITGAAGFIGSSLAHWLIDNTEHEVIGVDNLSTGYEDNMPMQSKRFTFYYGNLPEDAGMIFNSCKPQICFHLAAYAAEARSNRIRVFNHHNNTVSTAAVVNQCINHKCKLVFTSSVAVYSGQPPFTEEILPNPIDEYGVSKYTSELSIQIAGDQQGLDWCIVRPRNVYGERQSLWDSARNVMGIWMNQIRKEEPMTIFGTGEQKRAFTYIGDILEPLYNAALVSKEIINLGSGKAYSVLQANLTLGDIAQYDDVNYLPARHEVEEAFCTTDKSERLLGFVEKTDLHTGLHKMWEWAKEQPFREQTKMPELEIN